MSVDRCDMCGIWTRDPHHPHDRGCQNTYEAAGFGCYCDHVVCSGCCWAPGCKAVGSSA